MPPDMGTTLRMSSVLAKDDVAVAAEVDDVAAVACCCCWIVRARPLPRDQSRLPRRAFRAIAIRIGIIIPPAAAIGVPSPIFIVVRILLVLLLACWRVFVVGALPGGGGGTRRTL